MDQVKATYATWVAYPQPKKIKIIKGCAFACYALFLLLVVIYGFGSTGKKSVSIPKTVVFMEASPASLQAMRYLSQRRDIAVSMIVLTVNSWATNVAASSEHIGAFMQQLQNEGFGKNRIPMYYGNSVALVNQNFNSQVEFSSANPANTTACTYRRVLPDILRVESERMFGASTNLNKVQLPYQYERPSFFGQELNAFLNKNKANFLVLGPCTDAAWFLQNYPQRRGAVTDIYVAGGSFKEYGDVQGVFPPNRVAEMNFFFDPLSANYIVQGSHGRPVTLLPLDVAMTWPDGAYDTIIRSRTSSQEVSSAGMVADSLLGYHNKVTHFGANQISLSMMATAYLADPYVRNGAAVTSIAVEVSNGGTMSTDGKSFRPSTSGSRANVNVVLKMKDGIFWSRLLNVDKLPPG